MVSSGIHPPTTRPTSEDDWRTTRTQKRSSFHNCMAERRIDSSKTTGNSIPPVRKSRKEPPDVVEGAALHNSPDEETHEFPRRGGCVGQLMLSVCEEKSRFSHFWEGLFSFVGVVVRRCWIMRESFLRSEDCVSDSFHGEEWRKGVALVVFIILSRSGLCNN